VYFFLKLDWNPFLEPTSTESSFLHKESTGALMESDLLTTYMYIDALLDQSVIYRRQSI